MKCLKQLWNDQKGNVMSVELLIVITGILLVSSIVFVSMSNPLKQLHIQRTENITGISRGY